MYELSTEDLMYRNMLMSNLDPELVDWTKKKTLDFERLMTYYRCAIKEVETKFKVLDEEYSLLNDRTPISSIKPRLKSVPSIIEKLKRKGIAFSIPAVEENLNDVAGVRVICSFIEDVYKLADALLSQDDITLVQIKDYIKEPKENGYRSLHIIIKVPIFLEKEKKEMKVEIQLRTIGMDWWASLEHQLRYKKANEFTPEMQETLFECAKISKLLDEQMDNLREKTNL